MAETPVAASSPGNNNVSIWDFILFNQVGELQSYIQMLQSKDDAAAEDKDMICQKVLDGRVENSVRFQFENPLVGMAPIFRIQHDRSTWLCSCSFGQITQ